MTSGPPSIAKEEWKRIEIDSGRYWISNMGRVWDRYDGLLKQYYSAKKKGPGVKLKDNGSERIYRVTQLVMTHWVGQANGKVIHHVNGNRNDNRLSNMIYLTEKKHNELHRKELRSGVHICICPMCGARHRSRKY